MKMRGNALSLTGLLVLASAPSALALAGALPSGAEIVGGSVSIDYSGSAVDIHQQSARAAINWQSFNIGPDAAVNFHQPSREAAALNRVTGSDISQIQGRLSANGQVFLINPNGIVFTQTAHVDVGSLVASTLDLDTDAFMRGDAQHRLAGDSPNAVINQGRIQTQGAGGTVAMIAARVRNTGSIDTPGGVTGLVAGSEVILDLGGRVNIEVRQGALDALVEQGGAIQADNGVVYFTANAANRLMRTVINHTGVTQARSLSNGPGGQIVLRGDAPEGSDQIAIAGTFDVSAPSARGGQVIVEAAHITLAPTARIDATGGSGGGDVLIGGDWQGGANLVRRVFDDPNAIRQATTVTMQAGASIDASATVAGDGGTIVLWSDVSNPASLTEVAGRLHARGGQNNGDGGQIETSGATLRIGDVNISTFAPAGASGEWLLDPFDFIVAASGGDITGAALSGQLADNNITILTADPNPTGGNLTLAGTSGSNGDIIINDAVTWSSGNTLTLDAHKNIIINESIDASAGDGGKLELKTSNTSDLGRITINAPVQLQAGANLTINGTDFTVITDLGEISLSGDFALGTSVDYGDTDWTPVGRSSTRGASGTPPTVSGDPFNGSFEGLGNTISNLNVTAADSDRNLGFFGVTSSSNQFSNIIFDNVTVTANEPGDTNAGILLGTGINTGIHNVHVRNSTINGNFASGGLIGELYDDTLSSRISNSSADITIRSTSSSTIGRVGGLVGLVSGDASSRLEIRDSQATVDIEHTSLTGRISDGIGGLVGRTTARLTIIDSQVSGQINLGGSSNLSNVGGAVGYGEQQMQIFDTTANVNLDLTGTSLSDIGGLVGTTAFGKGTGHVINRSASTGDITLNTETGYGVGGLIGQGYGDISIEESFSSGAITVTHTDDDFGGIGGLGGYIDGSVVNAYSVADITINNPDGGPYQVGGLAGFVEGNIENSYYAGTLSIGDLETVVDVGGLAGGVSSGSILNSFFDTTKNSVFADDENGRSTEELSRLATFEAAEWNIQSTANVSYDGAPLPGLRWSFDGEGPVWQIGTVVGAPPPPPPPPPPPAPPSPTPESVALPVAPPAAAPASPVRSFFVVGRGTVSVPVSTVSNATNNVVNQTMTAVPQPTVAPLPPLVSTFGPPVDAVPVPPASNVIVEVPAPADGGLAGGGLFFIPPSPAPTGGLGGMGNTTNTTVGDVDEEGL